MKIRTKKKIKRMQFIHQLSILRKRKSFSRHLVLRKTRMMEELLRMKMMKLLMLLGEIMPLS
jgi:hypothetical protein